MTRRLTALLVAMVIVTSAGACSVAAGGASSSIPSGQALAFGAKTIDGKAFSGPTLAGHPAVLWFWAPWCPICQGEAPEVANAVRAHPAVTFVGVAGLDQPDAMKQFVAKNALGTFTQLADVDGAVWRHFGIAQQPAFAFVSTDGSAQVFRGEISEQDLDARLNSLAKG
jgi:peroxiredoxin